MKQIILIGIILASITSCDFFEGVHERRNNFIHAQDPTYVEPFADSIYLNKEQLARVDSLLDLQDEYHICAVLGSTVNHRHDYLNSSEWDNQYRLLTLKAMLFVLIEDHPRCRGSFAIEAYILEMYREVNVAVAEMKLTDPECWADAIAVGEQIIDQFNESI